MRGSLKIARIEHQTESARSNQKRKFRGQHGADVLDRLLVTLDIDAVTSALEAFLLREQNLAVVAQRGIGGRWHAASRFALSTLRSIAAARGLSHEIDGLRHRLQGLEGRIRQLAFTPAPRERTIRALPSAVLEELCAIFDPGSARNPFRSEAERFRNYTLFHVLLHCGLRAGEALLLPVGCVRSQHDPNLVRDRHWITVRSMFEDGTSRIGGRRHRRSRTPMPCADPGDGSGRGTHPRFLRRTGGERQRHRCLVREQPWPSTLATDAGELMARADARCPRQPVISWSINAGSIWPSSPLMICAIPAP